MSRILRRPMFRGGRVAKAGGGLSQLRQGYASGDEVMDIYSQIAEKIPMPEKLQAVESGLRKIGQDKIADQFVLSMNRAAEEATPKAMAIFSKTIESMTIEDAYKILKGPDDGATEYLKAKGGDQLRQEFLPVIKKATNRVGVTEKYKALIDNLGMMSKYIDIESLDLDSYVTEKAIDGLFVLVANEEKLIRADPAARTTELLKKVFSES